MTTVACYGIAVLDLLFTVDELPKGEGKIYASSFDEVGGGVAANAAFAIARLGGTARYVGRVGTDTAGTRIREDLAAAGVDVSGVELVPGVASPVSAVLVDSMGERLIINHTDSSLFAEPPQRPDLAGVDSVLVDVRWPQAAAGALETAAAASKPGVFDFDRPMADGGGRLLSLASHVVFSEHALSATAGTETPEAALRLVAERTNATLAVTLGGRGTVWLDGEEIRHLPAFTVDVVDTVGAGDIFHGAFALALAERQPMGNAVRFASAAAAIKCSRPGARLGAPHRDEVEALLEEEG